MSTDHRALRRSQSDIPKFGNSTFDVMVGPPAPMGHLKRFPLHKDLAIGESVLFDNVFRNDWKESKEKVVPLPEHQPHHFQIFCSWIYFRRICTLRPTMFADEGKDIEWDYLANAWASGAYLHATDFQDAVADAILEKAAQTEKGKQSMHEVTYANSVAKASIRKLIVDIAVLRWDVSELEAQDNDTTGSDFFHDLLIAMLKSRGHDTSWRVVKPNCDYHEHSQKGCFASSTFNVIVGPPEGHQTTFKIHDKLGRRASKFFAAALKKGWKEGEKRTAHLSEYDPEHFQLFFSYIYHRGIFSSESDDVRQDETTTRTDKEWDRLAKAWALGNYLQATEFKDAVADAIFEKAYSLGSEEYQYTGPMHEIIYPNSTSQAPIRRLLVDIAAAHWNLDWIKAQKNDPQWSEFFWDLTIMQREAWEEHGTLEFDLRIEDTCEYHEHAPNKCYRDQLRRESDPDGIS